MKRLARNAVLILSLTAPYCIVLLMLCSLGFTVCFFGCRLTFLEHMLLCIAVVLVTDLAVWSTARSGLFRELPQETVKKVKAIPWIHLPAFGILLWLSAKLWPAGSTEVRLRAVVIWIAVWRSFSAGRKLGRGAEKESLSPPSILNDKGKDCIT